VTSRRAATLKEALDALTGAGSLAASEEDSFGEEQAARTSIAMIDASAEPVVFIRNFLSFPVRLRL
jgi:hypothetical protein